MSILAPPIASRSLAAPVASQRPEPGQSDAGHLKTARPPVDPADPAPGARPEPTPGEPAPGDQEPPGSASGPVEGCGTLLYTTVCHDLCVPYSESGCLMCSTRTYLVCSNGSQVGQLDGELVIVRQDEKVDCVSTC